MYIKMETVFCCNLKLRKAQTLNYQYAKCCIISNNYYSETGRFLLEKVIYESNAPQLIH